MDATESLVSPSPLDQNHCQSSHKNCKRPKLKGFDFCHKHILEDNNSPFQRCCFMSKSSGKQCTNPAPKFRDKKTFCLVHTRNPKLKKAHAEQLKRKKISTNQLSGTDGEQTYILRPNLSSPEARHSRHRKRSHSGEGCEEKDVEEHAGDSQHISLSDSSVVQATWFGDQQSDAESVDSEEEDPLRHAGVWTLEEGIRVYCSKLRRLKHLYKCQHNRLTHVLKERRRTYLAPFVENGKLVKPGSIGSPFSEEDRVLRSYQKLSGAESLLLRQAREKKSRVTQKVTYQLKCHHSSQGQRCPNKVLPMAKYCIEHICEDPNQYLFRQCTCDGLGDGNLCASPVFSLTGAPLCDMHISPRPSIPNEAIQRLQEGRRKRDLDKVSGEEVPSATSDSANPSSVNSASAPGTKGPCPGNIFSILESDDPKEETVPKPNPALTVKKEGQGTNEDHKNGSENEKRASDDQPPVKEVETGKEAEGAPLTPTTASL